MTVAQLGIQIDSSPAVRAVADLDKLVPAAARVEKSTNDMAAAVTVAAKRTSSATAEMGQKLLQAANDAENMAARINRSLQIGMRSDPSSRGRDLAEYGRQLDALRAKFNPVYAELARYKAVQGDIRQAHAVGAISVNEMTNALDRERRAALDSIAALKGRTTALRDAVRSSPSGNGSSLGGGHFNSANIGFQLQDIAVTSQMGMNPMMIALQQGTQLSAELNNITASGQKVGPAIAGAFMSVLNPVSLVTLGVVGAGAALIQMAMEGVKGAKTVDDAFKAHATTLDRIDERYAGFSDRLIQYQQNSSLLLADARASLAVMEATARAANQGLADKLVPMREYDPRTDRVDPRVDTQFKPFEDAILSLDRAIQAGKPNLADFYETIERRVAIDPSLRDTADTILKAGESALKAQFGVDSARQAVNQLGSAAQDKLSDVVAFNKALSDLAGIAMPALSDMDRAAERYRAAMDEALTPGQRAAADTQFIETRTRIQNQIAGSQVPIPTARPNDIEIWDDRTEAAENAAKEAEKLAKEREREKQQRARARQPYENMANGQRDQLELLRTEAGLLGESEQARERVIASLQVEQQIRRLNIPLYGSEAQALRANAAEIIQLTEDRAQAMKRMAEVERDWSENRDIAKGFMTDLTDGLRDGTSLWKSFADAALNALNRITDKLLDRAFEGILDAFMPKPGGTGGSGGFTPTIGGFASMIFGAGGQNGGGANDNYAPGAVTRAPLGVAAYRDAIASIESAGSGDYAAIGPTNATMGRALGRYQIMEANVGPWSQAALGKSLTPTQFMADPSAQDAIFDHRFGGYVSKYGEKGAAQAWFGGEGSVGKLGRKDVLGTTVGSYGEKFNAALERATAATDKMATGSIDAAKDVGQFGNTLANAFPAAPSAPSGGLGGILGNLFGGGATMASMSAISPLAASHIAGGGVGLFSEGGYSTEPVDWLKAPRYAEGIPNTSGGIPAILHPDEAVVPLSRGRKIPVDLRGANSNQPATQSSGGTTTVVISLADGLRAEIVGEASENTVKIVQQNNQAMTNYHQNGGN